MSRFEKIPLEIIEGNEITVQGKEVFVKSDKGKFSIALPDGIQVEKESERTLRVTSLDNTKKQIAFAGMVYRMILNAMIGLTRGFKKELQIAGVGYRWSVSGNTVNMQLGFSHDIAYTIPDGVTISVKADTLTIEGTDKALVGQVAANIQSYRPVEPYKGKGIRITGQHVIRKAGKSGGT